MLNDQQTFLSKTRKWLSLINWFDEQQNGRKIMKHCTEFRHQEMWTLIFNHKFRIDRHKIDRNKTRWAIAANLPTHNWHRYQQFQPSRSSSFETKIPLLLPSLQAKTIVTWYLRSLNKYYQWWWQTREMYQRSRVNLVDTKPVLAVNFSPSRAYNDTMWWVWSKSERPLRGPF